MARTLTEVRATLVLLQAQYDALAASSINSMSSRARQETRNQMKDVRTEIEVMERLEANLIAEQSPGVGPDPGVSYAQFKSPRSGY